MCSVIGFHSPIGFTTPFNRSWTTPMVGKLQKIVGPSSHWKETIYIYIYTHFYRITLSDISHLGLSSRRDENTRSKTTNHSLMSLTIVGHLSHYTSPSNPIKQYHGDMMIVKWWSWGIYSSIHLWNQIFHGLSERICIFFSPPLTQNDLYHPFVGC